MKIQIIELYTMQDLLSLCQNFLFRMDFPQVNRSVYYSGTTSDSFIGLNVYIGEEKYEGDLTLDPMGKIKRAKISGPRTFKVIHVKNDNLLKGILANYLVGYYESKSYEKLAQTASSILEELKEVNKGQKTIVSDKNVEEEE